MENENHPVQQPSEQEIRACNIALIEQRRIYRKLHFENLCIVNPDVYYDNQRDRKPFKAPKDRSRKESNVDSGITLMLKFKAWFSQTSKAELEKRKKAAETLQKQYAKSHLERVVRQRSLFYQEQDEYNESVEQRRNQFANRDARQVCAFFRDILLSDYFSINIFEDWAYEIDVRDFEYCTELSELSFSYRIPDAEEICVIKRFLFDEKNNRVDTEDLEKTKAKETRLRIVESILLRAMATVFCSDNYEHVDRINITGFMHYFDPAYGNYEIAKVINVKISRDVFSKINPEQVDLDELFKRLLKAKVSGGLYE